MEDYLIRGVAAGGLVTFSAAHTASLAERARQIHGLQPLAAAALGAEGTTVLSGLHHIDRGYEGLEEMLQRLGANVERREA